MELPTICESKSSMRFFLVVALVIVINYVIGGLS